MRFKPEEVNREAVAACFAEHRAAIEALIGGAQVEHVGSTAVPGALPRAISTCSSVFLKSGSPTQVGADPDRYVAAKARFIEGVLGRTPNTD